MITVVEAGCAECHGSDPTYPLIEKREFESVEAAKAEYETQGWLHPPIAWVPHPQGGEHVMVGQGSVWILP